MSPRFSLIVDTWDPGRGGLESYAAALVTELAARDLPIEIVCGACVPDHPLPVPGRVLARRGRAFYAVVDRAAKAGELGVPLWFRHPGAGGGVFLPLGGLFVSALEARRGAEPFVLRSIRRIARALSPRTRAFLARERAFFAAADPTALVLAASERTAAAIGARFRAFAGRVVVTGLPVDTQRFRPASPEERQDARRMLGVGPTAQVVLWLGQDALRKGRVHALAVQRNLRAHGHDTVLVMAGHGCTAGERCGEAVRSLGPRTDVDVLLRAADLLLHPTFEDNFALAVIEALSSGVPVVTTRSDGAAARIAGPPIGVVVGAAADHAALFAACRDLLVLGVDERHAAARRAAVIDCATARHFDRLAELLAQRLR